MSTPTVTTHALLEVGGLRPGWRFTEPEGPWPGSPTPGHFLSLRCWIDPDGLHVWQAHDCVDGRCVAMLPWPTWQRLGIAVAPSISCETCGLHTFGSINAVLASLVHLFGY